MRSLRLLYGGDIVPLTGIVDWCQSDGQKLPMPELYKHQFQRCREVNVAVNGNALGEVSGLSAEPENQQLNANLTHTFQEAAARRAVNG